LAEVSQPPDPVGIYEPYTQYGRIIVLSAISSARDGAMIRGKAGKDLDLEMAREAARRAAANLVAVLLDAVGGDASKIEKMLLVRGYVNAAEDFPSVHKVIDAASELIIEHLGDRGRHARTALGCATLPDNNAVTLEGIAVLYAESF
jgi:enamine deaminase RidA (YjgF/YER057c/UK114 family)